MQSCGSLLEHAAWTTAPQRSQPMQRCLLLRSSEGRKGKSEERAVTVVSLSPPPPPPAAAAAEGFPSLLVLPPPPLLLLVVVVSTTSAAGLKQTPHSACAGSDRRCDSSSSKNACGAGG